MGCSNQAVVPNIQPERKPLVLPTPKPLVLKPVEGQFVVGESKETSTYVLTYQGYNDFLSNNKLVSNRIQLLRKQIVIIKDYYSKP